MNLEEMHIDLNSLCIADEPLCCIVQCTHNYTIIQIKSIIMLRYNLFFFCSQTAYPVQTVWLALSFRNAPRCTFIYLYLFHYNEIFLPFINVHPFQSTEPNDGEVMVRVILLSGY